MLFLLVALCWLNIYQSLGNLPDSIQNLRSQPLQVGLQSDMGRQLPEKLTASRLLGVDGESEGGEVHDDHKTDDHGFNEGGHTSGHPSLFHALSAIHVERGTVSMFIIIAFIVALKQCITALYAVTQDTPVYAMISKIEEELMLVGTSSFLFKVILNTTNFGENKWAYPLEFAETLIPIIAFSYCGLGVYVVLISLKQCYTWSRAHNLKVLEILDEYFEATKTIYFK